VRYRKINRATESGEISRRKTTARNKTGAGTWICGRRGQRLGVYEAPRRRRLIDLTSRIPQPLTIYTDCVPPSQRIHTSAEGTKRKNCQSSLQKKKNITKPRWRVRFDIHARLNPLSPEKIGLSIKWRRQADLVVPSRISLCTITKMLGQTLQMHLLLKSWYKTRLHTSRDENKMY